MKRTIRVGDRFNSWTVIREIDPLVYTKVKIRRFMCECACGAEHPVALTNLASGASKGCQNCHFLVRASFESNADVEALKRDVFNDPSPLKEIADRHGVTVCVVAKISSGKTWRKVPDPIRTVKRKRGPKGPQ